MCKQLHMSSGSLRRKIFNLVTLQMVKWQVLLGNGMCWGNLHELQVWVIRMWGMGYYTPTCELQNESNNVIFGPKLSELQLTSWNSSKLAFRGTHFWAVLEIFGLVLMGKPVGLQIQVRNGSSLSHLLNTCRFTHALPRFCKEKARL